MRVTIKFLTQMMKNGQLRKVDDEIEVDATTAILLARKGNVVIPGYEIKTVKKEIEVDTLVEVADERDN